MKKLMFLLALSGLTFSSQAQEKNENWEEKREAIKAMKVGFITQRLELTPQEAEKFWPVYNQLEEKIDAQRKPMMDLQRQMRRGQQDVATMNETQLNEFFSTLLNGEEKIAQLKKEYHKKFITVLGAQKTAMLYLAEMDFQREMMRRGRERSERPENQKGNRPPQN